MNTKFKLSIVFALAGLMLSSCKKEPDTKNLWQAVIPPASPIDDAVCLSGSISGTMLAGKTYNVCGDIFINQNDSLIIQEGVTINFKGSTVPVGLGVKGKFDFPALIRLFETLLPHHCWK